MAPDGRRRPAKFREGPALSFWDVAVSAAGVRWPDGTAADITTYPRQPLRPVYSTDLQGRPALRPKRAPQGGRQAYSPAACKSFKLKPNLPFAGLLSHRRSGLVLLRPLSVLDSRKNEWSIPWRVACG